MIGPGRILLGVLLAASSASAKTVARPIAIVNGEPILMYEFARLDQAARKQIEQLPAAQREPKLKEARTMIIDQLVDERLMLQEAKKRNLRVTKLDLDDGVREVRQRFPTETEFQKELDKEGMTETQFRQRIKDQLLVKKLLDQEIRTKLLPPEDAEVENFYKENEKDMLSPEQWRLRHILVRAAPDDPMAQKMKARKKLGEAQTALKKGEDFGDVARRFSEDPESRDRGGDLGYFSREMMRQVLDPAFEKAASGLEVGRMSDVVDTPFGFHLVRCEEKKASRRLPLEEVREELRQRLQGQRLNEKFRQFTKGLREKAALTINEPE